MTTDASEKPKEGQIVVYLSKSDTSRTKLPHYRAKILEVIFFVMKLKTISTWKAIHIAKRPQTSQLPPCTRRIIF